MGMICRMNFVHQQWLLFSLPFVLNTVKVNIYIVLKPTKQTFHFLWKISIKFSRNTAVFSPPTHLSLADSFRCDVISDYLSNQQCKHVITWPSPKCFVTFWGGRDGWVCSRDLFETSWKAYEVLPSHRRGGAECFRVCFPHWRCYRNFEAHVSHTNVHAGCGTSWWAFLKRFWLRLFSPLCTYWACTGAYIVAYCRMSCERHPHLCLPDVTPLSASQFDYLQTSGPNPNP